MKATDNEDQMQTHYEIFAINKGNLTPVQGGHDDFTTREEREATKYDDEQLRLTEIRASVQMDNTNYKKQNQNATEMNGLTSTADESFLMSSSQEVELLQCNEDSGGFDSNVNSSYSADVSQSISQTKNSDLGVDDISHQQQQKPINVSADPRGFSNHYHSSNQSDSSQAKQDQKNKKRTYSKAFKSSAKNSTLSSKRLRRDSKRVATDGIASTNPIPLAIPILCERALPPDRHTGGSTPLSKCHTSATPTNTLQAQELMTTTEDSDDLDGLPSSAITKKKTITTTTQQSTLNSLLDIGHKCAKLMSATCVSEQLSKSYNE